MNQEEFELLSVRVLCGEASTEEVTTHQNLRSENPALEKFYGEIRDSHAMLLEGLSPTVNPQADELEEIRETQTQAQLKKTAPQFPVNQDGAALETLPRDPKASDGDTPGPRNKLISFILPLAAAIAVFLVVKNGWLLTTDNSDEQPVASQKDPVVQEKGIKGEQEGNLLIGNLRWDAARTDQRIAAIDIREEIRRLEQEVEEATATFAGVTSDEKGFLTLANEPFKEKLQIEFGHKRDETARGSGFAIKGDLEAILQYDDPTEKLSMLTNYAITRSLSDSETIRLVSEITESVNAITSGFDAVGAQIIEGTPPASSED